MGLRPSSSPAWKPWNNVLGAKPHPAITLLQQDGAFLTQCAKKGLFKHKETGMRVKHFTYHLW